MNNIHVNGYNYGSVDKSLIIVRVVAIIVMLALGAFLWIISREDFSWKKSKSGTEITDKHVYNRMASQ